MVEGSRLLGGFDPDAGRNQHDANAPQRIPLPSLLRSLLSEHLDPGYAAAAAARRDGAGRPRAVEWGWQVAAALAVAAVFGIAAAQAQTAAPVTREAQQVLAGSVRAAEATDDQLTAQRNELTAQVAAERRSRLEGDALGRRLLGELDVADVAAAATPVIGPGLTVTVTDPGMSKDLSDVSKQRVAGSRQVILDRDLQLVVNSLWVSGAEAVAVGGVRIGPNVTIRQAGGGILVDNQPISSPYVLQVIGPPNTMADTFDRSTGLQRLRLLETSYGVGVSVSAADALSLPAGSVREVNFARQIGP
ncbi:DUF881 domain-containing protein [Mycolicibacterium litorale]|uniref:Uncharacterized protein n=1 Tax=Mycolicibacterium litorale TaxID=758802 RepID=A0AAD1IJ35_9MYCO|nr:DUF881 domain-containing protein [Mycolicibacterium litorale]MCV7418892.1 DUF881 domain-containing protein [Mycolicibacterium litorale]TDY00322.1 uncharacterized protein YlxW (UPF0749 family) [Mycolicibacterium litorale]BBY15846.1 hypothetical protein MLIT_14380 [Mycolicibacterium litorale]